MENVRLEIKDIEKLRYESSTLILYKELSSPIFQSLWVSKASVTPLLFTFPSLSVNGDTKYYTVFLLIDYDFAIGVHFTMYC